MRVLHAIWSMDPAEGGPPVALAGLAAAQVRTGLTVSVAVTTKDGESNVLVDALRAAQVNVHAIGPCAGRLRRHPNLAPAIDALVADADVAHLHGVWDQIQHVAARAARRRSMPYVISPHGMLERYCLAQKWLKKRLYLAWRLARDLRGAAAVHFTAGAERVATAPLFARHEVILEPCGLDWHEFESLPPRGQFRRRHGIDPARPLVLFLGRVVPKKGPDVLLDAMARMTRTDALLAIAGPSSDNYRAALDRLVARHALNERVRFTGMLHGRERIEALVDADVFVLPSRQENFGIAVAESLAAGTPVVVSDRVALSSLIGPAGVGGVTTLDPAAVARELDRWLTDQAYRAAAAARARPFAREHFDWDRIAERWTDHYARARAATDASST